MSEQDIVELLNSYSPHATDAHAAAAEITSLRARVAELEGALRPFAEKQTWRDTNPHMELNPGQEEVSCIVGVEHIYQARAVLAHGSAGRFFQPRAKSTTTPTGGRAP